MKHIESMIVCAHFVLNGQSHPMGPSSSMGALDWAISIYKLVIDLDESSEPMQSICQQSFFGVVKTFFAEMLNECHLE